MDKIEEILKAATMTVKFVQNTILPLFEDFRDYSRRAKEKDQLTQLTLAMRAIQFYEQAMIIMQRIGELEANNTFDKKTTKNLNEKKLELESVMNEVSNMLACLKR